MHNGPQFRGESLNLLQNNVFNNKLNRSTSEIHKTIHDKLNSFFTILNSIQKLNSILKMKTRSEAAVNWDES